MAYSEKVVDHYEHPRNVGAMDKGLAEVGTGLVGAPECGDVMRLQIRVNPETQVIEEAKFKTFGCGSAIASSSLATEWVKGKTVDEAMEIKNTDIVKELALPPVKIHCWRWGSSGLEKSGCHIDRAFSPRSLNQCVSLGLGPRLV